MSHQGLLSSLVRHQLPEFIRSDYDTFVLFLEAYYEYLEQNNKANDFGKHLLNYADIDQTLSDFETHFFKKFIPLIPPNLINDKPALIKYAKQFYTSKGTAKAFQFFFRALYGEEIDLFYPKDFVLRASDGQYVQVKSLRCHASFSSNATGNGTTTEFRLFEATETANELEVYINDVLQSSGYSASPNRPYITFTTAPAAGAALKFVYNSDTLLNAVNAGTLILNATGVTSGATGTIERANKTTIGDTRSLELFITPTSVNSFTQGELVTAKTYYTDTDYLTLTFTLLSLLGSITITSGGASYNIGDPVLLTGGTPEETATAVVEQIYTAIITRILILKGGAGFREGDFIHILSTPNTGLTMAISEVDVSEYYHLNTVPINGDIISLYENVAISNSNYGFPVAGSEDQNTRIVDALSDGYLGPLGPITNVQILTSTVEFASLPVLDAQTAVFVFSSTTASSNTANGVLKLVDLGILGRMNVVDGGIGYTVGDELIFTNITSNSQGYGEGFGAAAEVTSLHTANGGIKTVKFQPPRIDGTVNTTALGITVTGTGTVFSDELAVGDRIEINSESRYVNTISNNTSLTVNVAWDSTSTNRKLGLYRRSFIGGERYRQDYLPTVTVSSSNVSANGANIKVEAIYADGEQLLANSPFSPGQIQSILITDRGTGYDSVPVVDLTGKGNGLATAIAALYASQFTYPGKFITTDSLLSSDRRIQDQDYYQTYSYVIQSKIALPRYKQILLDLLHPTGTKLFAEYVIDENLISTLSTANTAVINVEKLLAGTVNVSNSSITVTGTNTTFNIANSQGYLIPGGSIVVNNELRTVNTIINNTSLTVTSTFQYASNGQTYIAVTSR